MKEVVSAIPPPPTGPLTPTKVEIAGATLRPGGRRLLSTVPVVGSTVSSSALRKERH